MDRIPEPHELADAHYARLEEQYEKSVEGKTCGDCGWCEVAPKEWSSTRHGYCRETLDFVRLDQPVKGFCGEFVPF